MQKSREPGGIKEAILPMLMGENRFGEFSGEVSQLLIDVGQHDCPSVQVRQEQPVRLAAAYLLLALKFVKRVGRPIDDRFTITQEGKRTLDRLAK